MARAVWYRADGLIEPVRLAPDVKDLEQVVAHEAGHYLVSVGSIWLYLHVDNDLEETHRQSALPLNKALRDLVPASKYVGDVLAVKAIDELEDTIDLEDNSWDLKEMLRRYNVVVDPTEDHHLRFSLLAPESD